MTNKLVELLNKTPQDRVSPQQVERRKESYYGTTLKLEYEQEPNRLVRGTGILLTTDGYFLTNAHVYDSNDKTVTASFHGNLPNSEKYTTEVKRMLFKSKIYDLALGQCYIPPGLEIKLEQFTPKIISAQQPTKGEPVLAYGFRKESVEISKGKITARTKNIASHESFMNGNNASFSEEQKRKGATATSTCTVRNGWSGGAVISEKTGNLIGISYQSRERAYNDGVPKFIANLIDDGTQHGFINIAYVRRLLEKYLEKQGVHITSHAQEKRNGNLFLDIIDELMQSKKE